MERWAGKVAVVTGAASGIGSAICSELCKAGMIVCGLSTRKDKVEQLRLGLLGLEGSLCAVECDITNEASVKAAYTWIEKTQGGIDLLVNNAGSVRCVCVCALPNQGAIINFIYSSLLVHHFQQMHDPRGEQYTRIAKYAREQSNWLMYMYS